MCSEGLICSDNKLVWVNTYEPHGVCLCVGFHLEYDLKKPAGERVKKVEVLCTECRVPHYKPLQPEKVYRIVIPSYLVDGGDGFSMIKEEKLKHDSGESVCMQTTVYSTDLVSMQLFT